MFRQNGKTIAERMRSPFVRVPVERLRVQQKLRMQRIMRLREVKLLYQDGYAFNDELLLPLIEFHGGNLKAVKAHLDLMLDR